MLINWECQERLSAFTAAGKRIPDALGIKTIANRCNVSADWLVGLSDSRSTDKDIQNAVRTTGLSDKAVSSLKEMNNGNVELLSEIIENIRMDKFLWNFRSYVYLLQSGKKSGSFRMGKAQLYTREKQGGYD